MSVEAWAILGCCNSTIEKPLDCPKGTKGWCSYHWSKVLGTSSCAPSKNYLPEAVV